MDDILPDDGLQSAEISFEREQEPSDENTEREVHPDCQIQYGGNCDEIRTCHSAVRE